MVGLPLLGASLIFGLQAILGVAASAALTALIGHIVVIVMALGGLVFGIVEVIFGSYSTQSRPDVHQTSIDYFNEVQKKIGELKSEFLPIQTGSESADFS